MTSDIVKGDWGGLKQSLKLAQSFTLSNWVMFGKLGGGVQCYHLMLFTSLHSCYKRSRVTEKDLLDHCNEQVDYMLLQILYVSQYRRDIQYLSCGCFSFCFNNGSYNFVTYHCNWKGFHNPSKFGQNIIWPAEMHGSALTPPSCLIKFSVIQ